MSPNNQYASHANMYIHKHALTRYILYFAPWKGLQIPLTLSLMLCTGLFTRFSFSPLAFRSSSAFSRTNSLVMFRTQTTFSRPLM